jgi:uncharacterized RDD family membrane protein YckC
MKCPSCNVICSDLRDICPNCLVDLRPTKALKGIAVTHPGRTYNELLITLQAQPKHPNSKKSFTAQIWTNSEELNSKELNVSSPHSITTSVVESLISRKETSSAGITANITTKPAEVGFLAALALAKEHAPSITQSTSDSTIETIKSQITTNNDLSDDIDTLFLQVEHEVRTSGAEFDMEDVALPTITKSEHLELYFAEVDESLSDNPKQSTQFITAIRSEERQIDADSLNATVAKIESAVESAVTKPVITKPTKVPQAFDIDKASPFLKRDLLVKAGVFRRLLALSIDLSATLIITLIVVVAGHIIAVPEFSAALTRFSPPLFTDIVHIASLLIALLPIVFLLLQLTLLISLGGTIGTYLCHITIVRLDGRTASSAQIFVRTLSMPVSLLLGGFLPIIIGKSSLADWAARTKVVRFKP